MRVGLLGTGYIADYHFAALAAVPGVRIVAVCDVSLVRAERFAAAKGIEKAYAELDRMIEEARLDVVHVLTPPNLHATLARRVLEAGCDVFLEKPLGVTSAECESLGEVASRTGRSLGVGHNFLFFEAYESLVADIRSGRLGQIDQIDVVWNKPLGQLRGGPFGSWMLAAPENILFEVGPHVFAQAIHLAGCASGKGNLGLAGCANDRGSLEDLAADARDAMTLPTGGTFFRRWEIRGWHGRTSLRLRLSFIDGYPEHYVHVRGTHGTATVDFEKNTHLVEEHTPSGLELDRLANVVRVAASAVLQAAATFGHALLAKLKRSQRSSPFQFSIARAVARFYATRRSGVDERLAIPIGAGAVELAERVARAAGVQSGGAAAGAAGTGAVAATAAPAARGPASVLVIGGSGFIGRALVRRLVAMGRGVRVLARDPSGCAREFGALGVEIVRGDFSDLTAVDRALEGITHVYHLARGGGRSWRDYEASDVAPTRRLAERCLERGVTRFFYASSIAIYDAGRGAAPIDETTVPDAGLIRANAYARSKVENERTLLALHREQGFPVVLFRPGVVVGRGASPQHWGVAAWEYGSVCRLWGDGTGRPPLVLAEDVAAAMASALEIPGIEGRDYNLCSRSMLTANDYLDAYEARAGVRLKRIPTSSLRRTAEAWAKWALKRLAGDRAAARPAYADWEGRSFAAAFDSTRARKELGWQPVDDAETLIREGIEAPVDEFFG
ncbi:MAG: NAD-dependent epimerase/dehydratase family protein [Myxococcota bacterium]